MRTHITLPVLLLMTATALAGCGDASPAADGGDAGESPVAVEGACSREKVEGCDMLGLRLDPPLSLDEALAVAADVGGTAIAVYRTDAVCVPDIDFDPTGAGGRVASRFAYVDAAGLIARRQHASETGLSPPITGLHISQAYWDRWSAEWSLAQADRVLIEGVAVWIDTAGTAAATGDERVAGTAVLPWRRTDSIDASYAGELLMSSPGFPGLGTPADPGC